jgi:hypothetical protein
MQAQDISEAEQGSPSPFTGPPDLVPGPIGLVAGPADVVGCRLQSPRPPVVLQIGAWVGARAAQ